jgi:ORF6C domain
MSDSSSAAAPDAVEQLPIPLFDGVVLAARSPDGLIHLALRDLCITFSLNLRAQRRRMRADEQLHLTQLRIFDGRQFRTLDFLLLDDVPTWLLTVQTRSVHPDVRERLKYVKDYLVSAVKAAFAQLTRLPEAPSRVIEDLHDLDRMEQAFQHLAELNTRQATIEQSQDRARLAYRDLQALVRELQTRVQSLEQQAKQRISASQRGTLYQLVQTWGVALAERRSTKPGEGIRMCWRLFNQRFDIATYTDLPAGRYDEALQFIKEQYRGLTGHEIAAAEQTGMEFEP